MENLQVRYVISHSVQYILVPYPAQSVCRTALPRGRNITAEVMGYMGLLQRPDEPVLEPDFRGKWKKTFRPSSSCSTAGVSKPYAASSYFWALSAEDAVDESTEPDLMVTRTAGHDVMKAHHANAKRCQGKHSVQLPMDNALDESPGSVNSRIGDDSDEGQLDTGISQSCTGQGQPRGPRPSEPTYRCFRCNGEVCIDEPHECPDDEDMNENEIREELELALLKQGLDPGDQRVKKHLDDKIRDIQNVRAMQGT